MQVTELQVQRSIEALADRGDDSDRSSDRTIAMADRVPSRDALAGGGLPVPDGLVALLLQSPSIRDDRVEAARHQLAAHVAPTAEALAQRMVGRLVCDRLR